MGLTIVKESLFPGRDWGTHRLGRESPQLKLMPGVWVAAAQAVLLGGSSAWVLVANRSLWTWEWVSWSLGLCFLASSHTYFFFRKYFLKTLQGIPRMVQRLGLCTFTTKDQGSIRRQGTRIL